MLNGDDHLSVGCFICFQSVQPVRVDQSQIDMTPGCGREGMRRAPTPDQQKVNLEDSIQLSFLNSKNGNASEMGQV